MQLPKGTRKRGKGYQISVYVGQDHNGKKKYERMTYVPTATADSKIEKELQTARVAFEQKVKSGRYYNADKLTFLDVMDKWKGDQTYKSLTQHIKEEYVDILNRRVVPYIGNIIITKILPLYLQDIVNEMEEDDLSPATIRKTFTVINSVMDYAFRMGLIDENPCKRIKLPKNKKDNEIHFFEINQMKTFIGALSKTYLIHHKAHERTLKKTGEVYSVPAYDTELKIPYQFQVYYTIAVNTGFRRGEMVALTWKDIDFENNQISITKAASKTRGKLIVKEPKTPSSIRTIKLPRQCFTMLREWKKQQIELMLEVGSKWKGFRGKEFDSNCVFIQTDDNVGTMMYLDTPTSKFADIIKLYNGSVSDAKDKLPEIRLHDLRHTHATILLGKGVDIETVAKRLGHSNASVTLDIYGHALESMDEVAAETCESIMSSIG